MLASTKDDFLFVSYSSKDKQFVDEIVNSLKQQGVNIWIDDELKSHVGEEWFAPVEDRMTSKYCKGVLFFISKDSVSSKQVLREIEYTMSNEVKGSHRGQKLRILPIEVEENIKKIDEWLYDLRDAKEDEKETNEHWKEEQQTIDAIREICFPDNNIVRIQLLHDKSEMIKQLMATIKRELFSVLKPETVEEMMYDEEDETVLVADEDVANERIDLSLLKGADDDYPQHISLSLEKNAVIVGRYDKKGRPQADYNFPVKFAFISRKHFCIIKKEGNLYIKDLNSGNGTYLNNIELEPERLYMLQPEDVIMIAKKHNLRYSVDWGQIS